ncbi:MAG: PAS domain-containing sensor histidine kinase [Alphaproteobacteria bacterium]|nr:PAS domain-containing sensor histidine kinase [Alphaproteobacteria bacterium]
MVGIAASALLAGTITFAVLAELFSFTATRATLAGLFAVILALSGVVSWQVWGLWRERRSGRAGAKLHVRLVILFSVMAAVPAVLMAIFAVVSLNLGMESWFSARVKSALDNAVGVAHQYAVETGRGIILDAGEMADGIQHDRALYDQGNHVKLGLMIEKLAIMTNDRGLVGSFLVDSHGNELASSAKLKYAASLKPSVQDIADAKAGKIVVDADPEEGLVHALIQLPALNDAYLLAVRAVDPRVFTYYNRTKVAVSEYKRLEHNRSDVQRNFAWLYIAVFLVVLFGAVWMGLLFADRLVRPISGLIRAAERVSEGDLRAQVTVERDRDEIGKLGLAFNRMTQQLSSQRSALIDANLQIDERRRFTETVLAGVSAGVIGVASDGQITIVNRAAARLLNASPEELESRPFGEAIPEFTPLLRQTMSEASGRASGEVLIKRAATPRSLSVQVTSERGPQASGYVVTFDDITELVSAQRTAAWADVARRIAHEIKNPLTPIQLSAERLKRKYGKEVSTDPEVFEQCTDTIIRQVGDIGRMVDEFSSFARMPTPVMRRENAQELVQQAVFLQRVANPHIAYETRLPKDALWFECDGRLVTQALTNVIKNAGEGIAARLEKGDETPGRIAVLIETPQDKIVFRVRDNGIGLPPEHRHRLTEPYVTTRAKGTGLGLAIVRKVMEDHGGDIVLQDAEGEAHGAEVVLTFPLRQKATREKGLGDEQGRLAANNV